MKTFRLFLIMTCLSGTTLLGQELAFNLPEILNGPGIKWDNEIIDLGSVQKNKSVATQFTFKNNGNEALVINRVKTSCGCTASEYPKQPIAPGETASIKVLYTGSGKGTFAKTITVYSNAVESVSKLLIKGETN